MSAFEAALHFVLAVEGGYVNDPADPGGETRYGISKRAHPDEDIAGLTLERAKEIYRSHYWRAVRGDDLPSRLALATFDAAVNLGPDQAVRLLQRALGVEVDGLIGSRTLAAAKRIGAAALTRMLAARALYYFELARARPSRQQFLSGWIRRCFDCHRAALEISA